MPTQAALAHSLAPQVRKGKVPGIYTTWEECSKQVCHFSGAEHRGFSTRSEAESWLHGVAPDHTKQQKGPTAAGAASGAAASAPPADYPSLIAEELASHRERQRESREAGVLPPSDAEVAAAEAEHARRRERQAEAAAEYGAAIGEELAAAGGRGGEAADGVGAGAAAGAAAEAGAGEAEAPPKRKRGRPRKNGGESPESSEESPPRKKAAEEAGAAAAGAGPPPAAGGSGAAPAALPEDLATALAAAFAEDAAPRRTADGPWLVRFDGGSRGNPGPAGSAAVLYDSPNPADGARPVASAGVFAGITTNNVAEYQGLIAGLEMAIILGIDELVVEGDSELIIKQIKGEYKVKSPELQPLRAKAVALCQRFRKLTLRHIRREKNAEADAAANRVMDTRQSFRDLSGVR